MAADTKSKGKVAIIGSGLIGQNWAMIFAGAGYQPCLFDVDSKQLEKALQSTRLTLQQYEEKGLLRGQGSASEQADKISGTNTLKDCVQGAFYIQECVPEDVTLKKKVFSDLDLVATDDQILASSSSCLLASMFAADIKHKENTLVAHPVNPPYFIPLVEIIPAPFTKSDVTQKVRSLMEEIGQSPITLRRECLGFALNRIQYACINECWNMYKVSDIGPSWSSCIQTGLLSAEDIDKVCYDGLGLRYAIIGPLETMHLNANGIKDYCERYAEGAINVQNETFAPLPVRYDTETAQKIEAEFSSTLPLDKLKERREWRDGMLAGIAKFKKEAKSNKSDK